MRGAIAAVILTACAREECAQPEPKPLMSEAVGEPCGRDANCAEGLVCRQLYVIDGYDAPVFTANACTAQCDAGCPTGAVCASIATATDPIATCMRACAGDADCLTTRSAGTCDAGFCTRLQCTGDTQCPSGFTCEVPAVVCCPPHTQCDLTGNVPGYCRNSLSP